MSEQIDQVKDWVNRSDCAFNAALHHVANIDSKGKKDSGWALIGGESVFTGSTFCEDGSPAYGLALPIKFSFIERVRLILLCTSLCIDSNPEDSSGFMHMITGFSVSGQDLFVDSTRGQVVRENNRVLIGEQNRLAELYRFKPWNIQRALRTRQGLADLNPVIVNDLMLMLDMDTSIFGRSGSIYRYGSENVNPSAVDFRQRLDESLEDWYIRYDQAMADLQRETDPKYYRKIPVQNLVLGVNFMNPARYLARRLLDVA